MNQLNNKLARDFFSTFRIEPIDGTAYILTSAEGKMLVRTHLIQSEDEDTLNEVNELMELHLSFDQQYVAPLLHFEKCEEGIRAFYAVDKVTLREEVRNRYQEQNYFKQEQLWVLLSSIVDSLLYLQNKGAIYGVLSANKIFVTDQIRLLDPSAFNLAPIDVSRISLHSPEIALSQPEIDFGLSDVYLLGLCMLEAGTLVSIDNTITKEALDMTLKEVGNRYSTQMLHVLSHLLKEQAEERPSLADIKEYIETDIQIQSDKLWPAEVLVADIEDCPSEIHGEMMSETEGKCDQLETRSSEDRRKMSEYERARGRFISSPNKGQGKENISPETYRTKQTLKGFTENERKRTKMTEESRETEEVEEFQLKIVNTVTKNRKKPRAVEIKNRNSEEVKKIQSIRYKETFTDPGLMSIVKQQTERAKEYFKTSSYR